VKCKNNRQVIIQTTNKQQTPPRIRHKLQTHLGAMEPELILTVRRGYITSTPKSDDFLKKRRFSSKYERDSCIPWPKNGERPYLAVPETPFLGVFFRLFLGILASLPFPFNLPNTQLHPASI